ncbi:FlgD immunoglobulin-like domain containing protein [Rathayibacter sp. PhB152]|uniref:FlgD immunoglobulin-like domain containing protein n=1 Tax=Rathayibacter sp. PhB152 TaxID=2485190 RepID=UPI001617D775|nr:FlgD immunoglobulin-like domain containing protein [Rathayibacter sp. PhB152]
MSARAFEVGRTRTPAELESKAYRALKLDYRGDGTYNTLYLRLRDATGEVLYYRVGTLNKTTWTTGTIDLMSPAAASGGNGNSVLDAPVSVYRLAVVRNGTQPSSGSVAVDNLRTVDDGWTLQTATPKLFTAGGFTSVTVNAGGAGPWRVVLIDSTGLRRTLAGSAPAAGSQTVTWDGLSDSGQGLRGNISAILSYGPIEGMTKTTTQGVPYFAGISARPADDTSSAVLGVNSSMSTYETIGAADTEAKWMEDAYVKYAREEFEWNRVEPRDGYFDWAKFDQMVAVAEARNLQIVGKLVYSADWASSAPIGTPSAAARYYPPSDLDAWRDYVGATVHRYAGRVSVWEVWNEPNIDKYWAPAPDPAGYASLLRASSTTIKAIDPSATVLVGGLAGGFSESFMDGVAANGAGDSYDGIALHMYVTGAPEPSIIDTWFNSAQTWVARNVPGRSLWLTEFGWTTCGECSARVTEQQQAQFLSRLAIDAAGQGVKGVVWFNLRELGTSTNSIDNYGLVERNGRAKPAYQTFAQFGRATARSVPIGHANPSSDGSTTIIDDLASTTGITRSSLGSGGSTSLQTTTSRMSGAGALAVDYNYSSSAAKGGVLTMNKSVQGAPTALSIWAYGNNSNATIFLKVRDATGESFESKIGAVGGANWSRLVFYLDNGNPNSTSSGGNNDNIVDYPIVVTNVHIYKSTAGPSSGRLILDDLTAHYGGATRGVVFMGDGAVTQAVYALAQDQVSLSVPGAAAWINDAGSMAVLPVENGLASVSLSPDPVFVVSDPDVRPAVATRGDPVGLSLVTGDRTVLTVRVFAADGTVVRTLIDGQKFQSGPRTVQWDGRRSNGAAPAAGSYYFRVTTTGPNGDASIEQPFRLT